MRIIDCAQGSEEWHAARAGRATASCFSKILATIKSGEASERRNYRAQLVCERLTGKAIDNGYVSQAMRDGIEREPIARAMYEVRTGNIVEQVGFMAHDEIEAGASPDGLVDDDGGIEIKAPVPATHLTYLRLKTEPPEYRAQIQGCMWISGRRYWDFVSYCPDYPEHLQLVIRRVHRDETYITGLELAVRLFLDEVAAEVAELERMAA